MTTKSRLVLLGIILSINIFAIQAKAQFAYESTRMGIDYKVYIYKKQALATEVGSFKQKLSIHAARQHYLGASLVICMPPSGGLQIAGTQQLMARQSQQQLAMDTKMACPLYLNLCAACKVY